MIYTYPMLIHIDEDGIWGEFPDLPGCQTWDETVEKTCEGAIDALEGYLLVALEDGQKINPPSSITDYKQLPDNVYATMVRANVDLAKNTKSVKKTLTIPEWLNEKAVSMGINFSQTLQEALIRKVAM